MKYGKFEMPNVKVPTIKMRSATEISMEKAMVPFKMKIVKYAGQDKAYWKFKNNELFDKEDNIHYRKRLFKLPEIKKNILTNLNSSMQSM